MEGVASQRLLSRCDKLFTYEREVEAIRDKWFDAFKGEALFKNSLSLKTKTINGFKSDLASVRLRLQLTEIDDQVCKQL